MVIDPRDDSNVLGGEVAMETLTTVYFSSPVSDGDPFLPELSLGQSVTRRFVMSGTTGYYTVRRTK